MNIRQAHNLACPIDGARLTRQDKQLLCEHGHAYDIARQGYVNLLPVQHKRSKQPGDSKEMVAARAQFLNAGFYTPVVQMLADIVLAHMPDDKDICLMDAGCGDGYYLDAVCDFLRDKEGDSELSLIGLDISKPAIVEAAKRNKSISWIVGTNRLPPVENTSVDMIMCVFGFQNLEGFGNILKPEGKVVLVEPGPDHLKELRAIIYTEVKNHAPVDLSPAEETGFSIIDTRSLQFSTEINNTACINHLLLMTPHYFRANKAGREAADNLQRLDITVDIVFRILKKTNKQDRD